jgi:ribosomal protein S18 acetylase RimI-like enzyme
MEYRKAVVEDAGSLLRFLCKLDECSPFMLYRPGERKANGHDLRGHIRSLRDNSAIFVANDDEHIVGYLAIYGGRQERCAHVASLSCGVLKEYRRRGIASKLWDLASKWAVSQGIKRIELSVVTRNMNAVSLYYAWHFEAEGFRYGSFVADDGEVFDEILMSWRVVKL